MNNRTEIVEIVPGFFLLGMDGWNLSIWARVSAFMNGRYRWFEGYLVRWSLVLEIGLDKGLRGR